MITVHPARARPADRVATKTDKTPPQALATFPAPISGWVSNQSASAQDPSSALLLDNFWPTTTGIEPRGGYVPRVDVASAVTALYGYAAGDTFIAADADQIYTFTTGTADGTTLTAAVTGQTSGDYRGVETQNDGGSFFTLVNGSDDLQIFDGSAWQAVNASSTPFAITGSGLSGTDAFTYVANYRERQYFVEGGTMNAWYLGVNSVAGTAVKFPIAGIFNKGGALHSITTFSSDAGDGLDDRILFLTTEGEFALYSGDIATDPALVGVYEIGIPIARDPFIRISGDVLIATKSGLIAVSAAINKDPSQLKATSVSRPIERDWEYWQRLQPSGWRVVKWPSRNMALVAVPTTDEPFAFAVNLETGAWTRFTGWAVAAMAVLDDSLHFATGTNIYEGDQGGLDNGAPFVCGCCQAFSAFGTAGVKTAKLVRGDFLSSTSFSPKFSVALDYTPTLRTPPNAADITSISGGVWDVAVWGDASWAVYGGQKSTVSKTHVVNGMGFALAVQLQITSGSETKLDCELVQTVLSYIPGDT